MIANHYNFHFERNPKMSRKSKNERNKKVWEIFEIRKCSGLHFQQNFESKSILEDELEL